MVVHRTFRHRHGRHGRREVLSMFKTVAQRSPRRSVAHRSLEGGRMKAHTSPWSQNGCTMVGHWSPRKKYVLLWTLCINLNNASAFLVPPLQKRPLSDHSGNYCASIRRQRQPFSHLGNGYASTLPPLRDLLRHYNSFGRSRKAQGSCCSSYTETEIHGFGRPLGVPVKGDWWLWNNAQRWI